MLAGLTVTLFVTVAFAGDAWAATLSTPQCDELSPKNAKPAVIINVMKNAVHKSRDLLTERVTRRTHLKIWPTQKACYQRQKHGCVIKRYGFASFQRALIRECDPIQIRIVVVGLSARFAQSLNRLYR